QLLRQRLRKDTQLAALYTSLLDELSPDLIRHVGRDRETDSDVDAGGRKDLRVDADQLAVGVYQRSAGIATIDGGVGLQEIFEASVAQSGASPLGADDPGCNCLTNAQGIPDGENDVPNAYLIGVAQG